jgi:hypothetical protein
MTRDGYELGSTIHERLDSIHMTPAEREAALGAMRTAFVIVDACTRLARALRHSVGALSHRPTVAH